MSSPEAPCVVSLTPPTPAASEALATLHALAYDRPWSATDIAAVLREPGGVAFQAGAPPQGFILLRDVLGETEVLAVAVAPQARRGGIGQALIHAALEHAAATGVEMVWLEVAEDNTPARALYARAGFVEIGRRGGYYPRPKGAVDALVMQRRLNSP